MIQTTVGGLLLAWVSLVLTLLLDGAKMGAYFKLAPAVLVLGGTWGATVVGFSMEEIKSLPAQLKLTFSNKRYDFQALIQRILGFATVSRRDGILALENELEKIDDEFLKKALQMAVDGVDHERLRETMETDLQCLQHWYKSGEDIMKQMGGFAPTLGVIGTVLGLIMMLAELDNAESMGPAIASAFIATMYGISTANLIYLPLANKIKTVAASDVLEKRIVLEGVLCIVNGMSPRVIEQSLLSYLYPTVKKLNTERTP